MEKIVMSLGGSIIVSKEVDTKFLKEFKKIISNDRRRFVIVTGGGKTARDYIKALRKEGISELKQNRAGIEATRLNAMLCADFFERYNYEIPRTMNELKKLLKKHRVVFTGGFKPGTTSDGTAASIAAEIGATTFINITNVKGLYTKDPKLKGAKFIRDITYKKFNKMIKKIEEKPGQHFVLDKLAAKTVHNNRIKVIILTGIKNLKAYLQGKKFDGTTIYE